MTHISTRHLEALLSDLDPLLSSEQISKADYMITGLLMKILQAMIEMNERGARIEKTTLDTAKKMESLLEQQKNAIEQAAKDLTE
jgi:hypothetical protein